MDLVLSNLQAANDCMKIRITENSIFVTLQDAGLIIPDSLACDVSPLPFTASTNTAVDAIIDVLKYSQKDMDAAVELVKKEVS